jgi:hypothetical protein
VEGFIVLAIAIAVFVALDLAAVVFGADSRDLDVRQLAR